MISVIVPCLNEEKTVPLTIPNLRENLSEIGEPFEIIAVSDGSSDKTVEKLEELSFPELKVISFKKNRGKGEALREGFSNSKGSVVFFHDADLLTPLALFQSTLNKLKKCNAVFASKNLPQSDIKRPLYRTLISRLLKSLNRLFLKLNLTDSQTGFKAFRREVLEEIIPKTTTKKFAFDLELSYIAQVEGYEIAEIPFIGKTVRPTRLWQRGFLSGLVELLISFFTLPSRLKYEGKNFQNRKGERNQK
jgi:glycosyltransferase involved in cell wall biosynthesis